VLALRARWADAGLATRDEMQTACCYAIQDKTWVSDPDGNQWEAFVVLEDHLPEASGAGADRRRDSALLLLQTGVRDCCATSPVGIVNIDR
jgi:hypothetical protein